jgi:large subunit ribosomal protein L23
MPVRDTAEEQRHWFREESKKYMTVEMETPFVWPENPESWKPWGKEEKEQQTKDAMRIYGGDAVKARKHEMEDLRAQAKEMLGWKKTDRKEVEDKSGAWRRLDEEAATQGRQQKAGKSNRKTDERRTKILQEEWEQKRTPKMLGRRVA